MKTIIVLPTYNEVGNLEPFTKAILALEPPVGILVVDDNSPDGTGVLADRLQAAAPEGRNTCFLARTARGQSEGGAPDCLGGSLASVEAALRDFLADSYQGTVPGARGLSW